MNTSLLYRYGGPLPELRPNNPADLALPSDAGWLRDNPEAVARVRAFPDANAAGHSEVFLAFRLEDRTQPGGWQVGYHKSHSAHRDGAPFKLWKDAPNTANANRLALVILADDVLPFGAIGKEVLVVSDLSEIDPFYLPQFAPSGTFAPAKTQAGAGGLSPLGPHYRRNLDHAYGITDRFQPTNYSALALDGDADWLRANPDRVGRVRFFEDRLSPERYLLLAFRVADPTTPDGWITAYYLADKENLGDKKLRHTNQYFASWHQDPTPKNEDNVIQGVLWRDAKRVGGAAEALWHLLILPAGFSFP